MSYHVPGYLIQSRTGKGGNCVATCYASLLGVPVEAIPELYGTPNQTEAEAAFLRSHGLGLVRIQLARGQEPPFMSPGTYHLIGGMGPRGYPHRVIGRDGQVLHDPHPEGTGLVSQEAWIFLVPIQPDPPALLRLA